MGRGRACLHEGGVRSEVDSARDTTYRHGDALGSTRGLTDGNGTITGTTAYGAFAEARGGTGATSQFGYTGEQHDPTTGFTHLRARDYDPATGRFASRDTVQPNAKGSQGYNRYAYVANNPCSFTDPSGMHLIDPCEELAALARGFVLAALALVVLSLIARVMGTGLGFFFLALAAQALLVALVLIAMVLACVLIVSLTGGGSGSGAGSTNSGAPTTADDLIPSASNFPSAPGVGGMRLP